VQESDIDEQLFGRWWIPFDVKILVPHFAVTEVKRVKMESGTIRIEDVELALESCGFKGLLIGDGEWFDISKFSTSAIGDRNYTRDYLLFLLHIGK
jgi:hypothetical protein